MFLDTSGLFSYLDFDDARHHDAVSLLHSVSGRLTHNYIFAELVPLCIARRMDPAVAIELISDILDDTTITVSWVGIEEHHAAIELLRARPQRSYSLCDAVSFILMRQHGITEAFTTDHHFEQEGFVRLLPP